jgi:hypothetical protein
MTQRCVFVWPVWFESDPKYHRFKEYKKTMFCVSVICIEIWLIWGIQNAVLKVLRRHLTGETKENHSMSFKTAGLRSEMRDKEKASRLRRRRAGSQRAASRGCAMLSILVKHSLFFLLLYSVFNNLLLCLWSYLGNKLAISIFICRPLLHLLTCCFPFHYRYRPQCAQLCTFTNVCLKAHLHSASYCPYKLQLITFHFSLIQSANIQLQQKSAL